MKGGWLKAFIGFIRRNLVNRKWRCVACNKEIFNDEYFCESCKKELPFLTGYTCAHCGRPTAVPEKYCLTCKNRLVSIERGVSVFEYKPPISRLIKKAKYYGHKYLLDVFSEYLYYAYIKNYFNADLICYVPMPKRRQRRRGYNQGRVLAERLSERINVPVSHCLEKTKRTRRQAGLNRKGRLNNLIDAFKVIDKKAVKDKTLVIVDDVTTTGATGEAVASKLKKAGAGQVFLLTVATVGIKPKKRKIKLDSKE